MITSLKEKIMKIFFNVQGYDFEDIHKEDNEIIVEANKLRDSFCPKCNSIAPRYDSTHQKILIGSILGNSIYARIKLYRLNCVKCGILTESNGISEGKHRFSSYVGNHIIQYSKHLSNNIVGDLLGLSSSTVYRIDLKELGNLKEKYLKNIPNAKRLTVDEVSYKRRHSYATVVTDLDKGKVLWLEKDRKTQNLEFVYDTLGSCIDTVKQVSMDLWPAYFKATQKKLPSASIVFDRFHISRMLNRAIESERREYQNSLEPCDRKNMKKNMRWVLLKRRENLSAYNDQRLKELKLLNQPLYEMYLLKEDFLSIFDEVKSRKVAKKQILKWLRLIAKTKFSYLKRFSKSITKRLWHLLNYFDNPISNAKAEGINNVIKTVLKRAYGYKNFDYFRLKILQTCGYLMDYTTHSF